jgi:type II secretory pathway pseudopilin PulG
MHSTCLPYHRRRNQQGYILMALLLATALILIALAAGLPVIATELRRQREDELIHRGVEYTRAIRNYYRKFGRYPLSLDQLEDSNHMRFLRKRYTDPITGSDFRLLHVGEVSLPSGPLCSQEQLPAQPAPRTGPAREAGNQATIPPRRLPSFLFRRWERLEGGSGADQSWASPAPARNNPFTSSTMETTTKTGSSCTVPSSIGVASLHGPSMESSLPAIAASRLLLCQCPLMRVAAQRLASKSHRVRNKLKPDPATVSHPSRGLTLLLRHRQLHVHTARYPA